MNGLSEIISGSGALFLVFSAAGFAVYLLALNKAPALGRTVAKTMAVGALSGLAFHAGGPALLIVALALSALGDAFLAHEGEAAFLGGLGSFLAAHIAYAVLFIVSGPGFADASVPGLLAMVVFGVGMGTLMVRKAGALALPVAAYVLAISVMGLGGVTLGGLVLLGACCSWRRTPYSGRKNS
jgi:uncharacterized membrane protein YhhN